MKYTILANLLMLLLSIFASAQQQSGTQAPLSILDTATRLLTIQKEISARISLHKKTTSTHLVAIDAAVLTMTRKLDGASAFMRYMKSLRPSTIVSDPEVQVEISRIKYIEDEPGLKMDDFVWENCKAIEKEMMNLDAYLRTIDPVVEELLATLSAPLVSDNHSTEDVTVKEEIKKRDVVATCVPSMGFIGHETSVEITTPTPTTGFSKGMIGVEISTDITAPTSTADPSKGIVGLEKVTEVIAPASLKNTGATVTSGPSRGFIGHKLHGIYLLKERINSLRRRKVNFTA